MHREVGGSGRVCDVGELGWEGEKGACAWGMRGFLATCIPPSVLTHWVLGSAA